MEIFKHWENTQFFGNPARAHWTMGSGKKMPIEEMSDSHLINSLNYMEEHFFWFYPHLYRGEWRKVARNIIEQWPVYLFLVKETLDRPNPWKDHEDGRTAHCDTLFDAYFVLKRNEEPPVVKEDEELDLSRHRRKETYGK